MDNIQGIYHQGPKAILRGIFIYWSMNSILLIVFEMSLKIKQNQKESIHTMLVIPYKKSKILDLKKCTH